MIHATRKRERKTTVVNPRKHRAKPKPKRKHKLAARKKQKTGNPAETLALGYLNPRRTMQHKKKTKKKQAKHRKVGNPEGRIKALALKPVQILYMGAMAAVGFLVTRQLPQLALKQRNTGLLGYFANLVVAGLGGAAAYRFIGPTEGTASLIGGGMALFNRIISEQTELGKQLNLSGIGDVQASGSLGALVAAYFPYPAVFDTQGRPVIPQAIVEAVRRALPPAAAPTPEASQPTAALAGMGRFAGRF